MENLRPSLGSEVVTHDELRQAFINDVLMPYLRQETGLLADIKMERKIGEGYYDSRIGGLYFEFKKPGKGVAKGIEEAQEKYITEQEDEKIDFFVTDGYRAAHVNSEGEVVERGRADDLAGRLRELLEIHAKEIIEPEDLLDGFGPDSVLYQEHTKLLWNILNEFNENRVVKQSYDMWKRIYAEAANLSSDAKRAVKKQAKEFNLSLQNTEEIRKFLFVTQTYFSILMKLMTGKTSGVAREKSINGWLQRKDSPIDSYRTIKDWFEMEGVVEHDLFDWFIYPARESKEVSNKISDSLLKLASTVDVIDYSSVETDLLRDIYQQSFNEEMRIAMGEFYTNEDLVDEVLDSVEYEKEKILDGKVLDPTCGSGTFLIRAIKRFREAAVEKGLDESEILEKITENIIGIDLHPFAVTMAKTNYLIAISDLLKGKSPKFIKKLEIPVYWTDSLTTFSDESLADELTVQAMPFKKELFLPNPKEVDLNMVLDKLENALTGIGMSKERFLDEFDEDVRLKFENTLSELYEFFQKKENNMWFPTLRNALKIYELKGNCDYLIGNPPWVRRRNVEESLRKRLDNEFDFYQGAWRPELENIRIFISSRDYALAFVEEGKNYLRGGGNFGFVITASVIRSLYSGKMREELLKNTTLLKIVDYSLSKVQLFEGAENKPLILAFEKHPPSKETKVEIEMVNRREKRKRWKVKQKSLPLIEENLSSPWMVVPP